MNDSISCSIKLNRNVSNSQGLLGFADGNAVNDFKFRNGTVLSSTADRLSIGDIKQFVLSCEWCIYCINAFCTHHQPDVERQNRDGEEREGRMKGR